MGNRPERRSVRKEIVDYVESTVIPAYASFDKGHGEGHARYVIGQAMELACYYDADPEMVYVAAACHDLGLAEDRKTHHLVSGRIIREDPALRRWFSAEQVETMAQAAEDHRASSDHEPRSIYGRLVAEADRQIVPDTVIRRTVQFGFSHYPELDREGHWQRTCEHLQEKYAEGGYLKLWIPESSNSARLAELRAIICDKARLRALFDRYFDEESAASGK
jgi:uncharacterized protein